jgi:hypothetical protein
MSSISGPIITFRAVLDDSLLASSAAAALQKLNVQILASNKAAAASITSSIADPLTAQASKIRALYAIGAADAKTLQAAQGQLVSQLTQQVSLLAKKGSFTKTELADLRRMTLELERQKDALTKNVPTGLTAGTAEALSRATVSAQIFARLTGLQIPRSLERIIAQSPALESALSGAFKGAAVAFVADQIVRVIDNLTGFSEALKEIEKQSNETFASVATANKTLLGPQTLRQVDTQILDISKRVEAAQKQLGLGGGALGDALTRGLTRFSPSSKLLLDQLDHEKQVLNELFTEQARLTDEQNRTQPIEVLKLANEAREVGLDGIRRVRTAEVDSLAVVSAEEKKNVITTALAQAQRKQIIAAAAEQIEKIQLANLQALRAIENSTANIGLGPIAAIAARAKEEIATLQIKLDRGGLGPEDITAIKAQQNAIQLRAQKETIEESRKLNVSANLAELQSEANLAAGLNKIEAERLAAIAQISQEELNLNRGNNAEQIVLTQQRVDVQKKYEKDLADFQHQMVQQTLQLQNSAAVASLLPFQRATAQILLDQQRQMDEIERQYKRGELDWKNFNDRREAIAKEASAKIADEISNSLQSVFDDLVSGNLGKRILRNIETFFFREVAQLLIRVGQSSGFNPFAGILGVLLGIPGATIGGGAPKTPPFKAGTTIPGTAGSDGSGGPGGGSTGKPKGAGHTLGESVDLNTSATDRNTDALNRLTQALQQGNSLVAGSSLFGPFGLGGIGGPINLGFPGGGPVGSSSGLGGGLSGFLMPLLLGSALLATGGGKLGAGLGALGGTLAHIGHGSIEGLIKNPGGQSTLGLVGLGIEGAGIAVAGHQTGGALGALEGAGGGALTGAAIGTMILPGIGTAVGAAIGAIAGFIGGIFGGKDKATKAKIDRAIARQFVSPDKFLGQEFDRAAGANFGDTLNSTFSEGPGGVFSSSQISGPRQAPVNLTYAPTIQAMDQRGVGDVLAQHGGLFAAEVGRRINSSNNGLADKIRSAVSPA